MKKRSDNRGFTLVELIIAIAILAIAISPLVANFIQASKLNLKGRKSLNAMNLAQDVMEGMSVYTATEVEEIVEGVISDNSLSLAGSLLPTTSTYSSLGRTSPDGDSKLVYELSDVKTANGANNVYDVKLTLDPTDSNISDFNGQDMADITEVNKYYDAVYTCPTSEVAEAIGELYSKSNFSQPTDAYQGNVVRTIKIMVEKALDPVTSQNRYSINVIREYKVADVGINSFAEQTGLLGESWTTTATSILNADSTQKPRSIYLYYEGIKGATATASPIRDNIVIESKIGEEITVYLVQQAGATYDPNYACNVKIKSRNETDTADTQDVHIVSNIRYNLNAAQMRYNFRDKYEDGTAIPTTDIEYPLKVDGNKLENITEDSYQKTSSYDRTRANYYYNSDVQKIDETLYQSNFTAGYTRNEKDTLYEVLIEVFDATSGERVAHYNGGLSN